MKKADSAPISSFYAYNRNVIDEKNLDIVKSSRKRKSQLIRKCLRELNKVRIRVQEEERVAERRARHVSKLIFQDIQNQTFNLDAAYDNCVHIIEQYLSFYNKLEKLKEDSLEENQDVSEKNSTLLSTDALETEEKDGGKNKNQSQLYDLIDKKKAIYKNKFLFEYDDELDIFTSSEEELIFEKKRKSRRVVSESGNQYNDGSNRKHNHSSDIENKENFSSESGKKSDERGTLWNQKTEVESKVDEGQIGKKKRHKRRTEPSNKDFVCEKVKINLLNRYPPYLRDLIRIIKTSKRLQKLCIYSNVFKAYCAVTPVKKINECFENAFQRFEYTENKERALKKFKRIKYRILRYMLLEHIYQNHEEFVKEILNATEEKVQYANANQEQKQEQKQEQWNVEGTSYNSVFEKKIRESSNVSKRCNECGGSTTDNDECKGCKERAHLLLYAAFCKKLKGRFDSNIKICVMDPPPPKHSLLTHILLNKKEKRPIDVEYTIQYHRNSYIYVASKECIFSDVVHANYFKNHFIDFIDIVRKRGSGYKLVSVIFDKYKNKNYMDYKKLKKKVDQFIAKKRNEVKYKRVGGNNNVVLKDTFHELLKNVLSPDGNDGSLFWEHIYATFYYCLQKRELKFQRKRDTSYEFEKEKMENFEKESALVIDSFDDIKNFAHGTCQNVKKTVEKELIEQIILPGKGASNIRSILRSKFHSNKGGDIGQNGEGDAYVDKMYRNFMNVKKMDEICETYVPGIWNKYNKKYRYIRGKKWGEESSSSEGSSSSRVREKKGIEKYLRKLNKECAIVEVSDSSDDDVYMNSAKITQMFQTFNTLANTKKDHFLLRGKDSTPSNESIFLKKRKNSMSSVVQRHCKEQKQWEMINLKRNCVIHPLFNSKPIGFKVEVQDFLNRQLDVYCINDDAYINVYKNTVQFLSDNFNEQLLRRYKWLCKLKEEFEQTRGKKVPTVEALYKERDNLLHSQNNKFIKEFFVIIDETEAVSSKSTSGSCVSENKMRLDIYDCAELTTYVVHSKKEKMNTFYEQFIKNEIYTDRWKMKMETKFLNYNYIYDSATVLKKSEITYAMAFLKKLVENLHCENFHQVSTIACLYASHKNLSECSSQEIVLKNMYADVGNIVSCLYRCMLHDKEYLMESQITDNTENKQWEFYQYLLNYRWDKKRYQEFMTNMEKYKYLLLYYIFYMYPQFLNICSIIRLNNFQEATKFSFIKHNYKYASIKQVLAPHVQDVEGANKAKELANSTNDAMKYLPQFNKDGTTIMAAFPLRHLIMMSTNTAITSHVYTQFVDVLNRQKTLLDLVNEIHPVCMNTVRYFKNVSDKMSHIGTAEAAKILFMLNAYLCFLSNHISSCDEQSLWSTFLYRDSATQNKEILASCLNGIAYLPPTFLSTFATTLLYRKGKRYIITLEAKGKVYVRALLLQLYLTNNHMPSYLVYKNADYKTVLDSLNLQEDNKYVSFRWR